MRYLIEYKNKSWTVTETPSETWVSSEVFRTWNIKEEEQKWWVYSFKNTPEKALIEGRTRILADMERRNDPMAYVERVALGRVDSCGMTEPIYELSRALVLMNERIRELEEVIRDA